jgi:hypothetical protein
MTRQGLLSGIMASEVLLRSAGSSSGGGKAFSDRGENQAIKYLKLWVIIGRLLRILPRQVIRESIIKGDIVE